MTIKEQHYDLKLKLNKIDSNQYRNLMIPEIDWILNEAAELLVKMIAFPREYNHLGFEVGQRVIDDIRSIVINEDCITVTNNIAPLPADYWHFLKADVKMEKEGCDTEVRGRFHVRQHDDESELSPFDRSSFEWRTVNGVFYKDGVKILTDGSFTVNEFCLSYLKKLTYFHNAEDYIGGTYNTLDGVPLTGAVDCELPFQTHREIVDIAVLIITGSLQIPDYQIKAAKIKLNTNV